MDKDTEAIIESLLAEFVTGIPNKIQAIGASGSQRRYFRVFLPEGTLVVCVSDNRKENSTFIHLSRFFKKEGIRVPEIYRVNGACNAYILEDLGSVDLFQEIADMHKQNISENCENIEKENIEKKEERKEKEYKENKVWEHMERALEMLVRFQRMPRSGWDKIVEFPPLDSPLINFDFRYAVENLIEPIGMPYDAKGLEKDFAALEATLLSYPSNLWGLMYRDFQSRNIMIYDNQPYFIDYQSCRYGPGVYDLVSFMWQAKAGFSDAEREKLSEIYVAAVRESTGLKDAAEIIRDNIPYWAAFRIIQTLGAYGLRGLKEGKPHFIESLRPAVRNLGRLMHAFNLSSRYPEIARIAGSLPDFL